MRLRRLLSTLRFRLRSVFRGRVSRNSTRNSATTSTGAWRPMSRAAYRRPRLVRRQWAPSAASSSRRKRAATYDA